MPRQPIFSKRISVIHSARTRRITHQITQSSIDIGNSFTDAFERELAERPLPEVHEETFNINIRQGFKYTGATIVSQPPSRAAGISGAVEIVSQPSRGAVGSQTIKVRVTAPPGSGVFARLRAYVEPEIDPNVGNEPEDEWEVLHIVDHESTERLRSLMDSQSNILLCIQGDDAIRMADSGFFNPSEWIITKNSSGNSVISINPAWETVVIIGILAATFISALTLLVLLIIVDKALEKNYKVEVLGLKMAIVEGGIGHIQFTGPTMTIKLTPMNDEGDDDN